MRIILRDYPTLTVAVVTMDPGDDWRPQWVPNILGGFLVYGSIFPIIGGERGPEVARLGWTAGEITGPWRESWDDPKNPMGAGHYVGGAAGAQWVCLTGRGSVTPQAVEGRYTLAAGRRFVVARGVVEFDNQHGEQGYCFAPREIDKDVTGAADILVVA